MEVSSPPRRLPPAERRDQLIDCALAIAARDGYENLAFEAVANRAGVTRNLVYHYFPGGRQQLLEAAVHRAGEQLSSGWVTDPDVPLGERLDANLNRMIDHASEPTDAWQLYRQGRGTRRPGAARDRPRLPRAGDRQHRAQPARHDRRPSRWFGSRWTASSPMWRR